MVRIRTRVDVYKKNSLAGSYNWEEAVYTTTEKVIGLEVTDTIGVGKDTFKFNLANPQGSLTTGSTSVVALDDNIKVYCWTGTGSPNTTSDLAMDGVVKDVSYEQKPDGRDIGVGGVNFVESFFNSFVWVDQTSGDVVTATREIISKVNELQMNALQANSRYIIGEEETDWGTIGNPTAGSKGPFPTMSLVRNKNSAAELLDEIWTHEFTSDGSYIWWVERNTTTNALNFRVTKKGNDPQETRVTQGGNETSWKVDHVLDGIFNVVYFNCGNDLRGHGQEYFYYDEDSMSKYGPVSKYYDKTANLAADLVNKEIQLDTTKTLFDWSTEGNQDVPTSRFPTSYPYTTSWLAKDIISGQVTGGFRIAGSDKQYNQFLREECEIQGRKIVSEVVKLNGRPRPRLRVVYPRSWTGSYVVRDVYVVSGSDDITKNGINLRCERKKFNDWNVEYEFVQDEDQVL